jgi:hypothetical protein
MLMIRRFSLFLWLLTAFFLGAAVSNYYWSQKFKSLEVKVHEIEQKVQAMP